MKNWIRQSSNEGEGAKRTSNLKTGVLYRMEERTGAKLLLPFGHSPFPLR